jgi:NADPH:quinone reductase-like Zn-dependent oxidoreductase
MGRLLGWLADGTIRPLNTTEIPFDRVADAHRALESGETVGKLVLVV